MIIIALARSVGWIAQMAGCAMPPFRTKVHAAARWVSEVLRPTRRWPWRIRAALFSLAGAHARLITRWHAQTAGRLVRRVRAWPQPSMQGHAWVKKISANTCGRTSWRLRASARSIGLAARLGGTLSARRLRRRAPLTFRNRALVGGLRAAGRVSRQLRTQDLVPSRGPPMVTRQTRNVQCRTLVMPRGLAGGELRDMELCIFGGCGPALVLAHVESILVSRAFVYVRWRLTVSVWWWWRHFVAERRG